MNSIKIKCIRCSKQIAHYHSVYECPSLHYIPFKLIVISKYLNVVNNIKEGRRNFSRMKNNENYTSALKLRKKFFREVENFKIKSKKELEDFEDYQLEEQKALP